MKKEFYLNVLLIRYKKGFQPAKLKDVLYNKVTKNVDDVIYNPVLQLIISENQSNCENNLTYDVLYGEKCF